MDHFKRSQEVRGRILQDKPLLKKLADHFLEQGKLEQVIGAGSNNIHYRAGMLPDGLWIATREQFQEQIPYGDPARSDLLRARFRETGNWKTLELETFCREAYCWTEFGLFNGGNRSVSDFVRNGGTGYVTSFAIGVRYKPPWKRTPLYALLVEDLTAGGVFSLKTHPDADWIGQIEGTNAPVQLDLDDFPRWRKMHPGVPDYMSEQAIIDFGSL